jgi:hypothetical protein
VRQHALPDGHEIEVEDCKKPTPICKNGLVAEIMQTGMIEIFASQLNDGRSTTAAL